jgi:hypothetical protein
MGMDVYGVENSDAYFRAGGGSWGAIWAMTATVAPEMCALVQYPWTNDGSGLDATDTAALHATLQFAWNDDLPDRIRAHNAALAAVPDDVCQWCNGTGVRTDEVGVKLDMPARNYCNGCDGQEGGHPGRVRPSSDWNMIDLEHFESWITFLSICGGFEIW